MSETSIFRLGLLAWTVTFVGAFLDFGGGGGAFGLSHFLLWQVVASTLAVLLFIYGRRFEKRSMQRVASRVPGILLIGILIAAALFAGTAGFITDGTIDIG